MKPTPLFFAAAIVLFSRAASANPHSTAPKGVATPGAVSAAAKTPIAVLPGSMVAPGAGTTQPKTAPVVEAGAAVEQPLPSVVSLQQAAGETGSLSQVLENAGAAENPTVAAGEASVAAPTPRQGWGALIRSAFTSKEAKREQERDAFIEQLKQAAQAGDEKRLGGMLYRIFDYQDEPLIPAVLEAVIDAQARRGPREAMGTAIYLINGARNADLVRALTAKAFPLIDRADRSDPKQLADVAMLSGVVVSASGARGTDSRRAFAAWRAAVRSLDNEAGIGFAFAAASNAAFERGSLALRVEGLRTWRALVANLARSNRAEAVKEALRVRDGYEGFGEEAMPFRSLAALTLRQMGYADPAPTPPAPVDRAAELAKAFAEQPKAQLAETIARVSSESPLEYRAGLRAALETLLPGAPRLQRHLTALDENGDGKVSLRESYRTLRAMRFGRVQAAIIAFGSQTALVASTGRVGWFSFAVDAGPKGLHRTVDTGAMDPEADLAKKLNLFMVEDVDGDGFVDKNDVGRLIDKRARQSKAGKIATFFVKAANKAEFGALFQLMGGKMSRDDLHDFYTGSLFFSLLTPDALAQRIVGLRARR